MTAAEKFAPTTEQKMNAAILKANVQYLDTRKDGEDDHRGPAVAFNVPASYASDVAEAMCFFGLYPDVVQSKIDGCRVYVTLWTKGYRHHDQNPDARKTDLCEDAIAGRF